MTVFVDLVHTYLVHTRYTYTFGNNKNMFLLKCMKNFTIHETKFTRNFQSQQKLISLRYFTLLLKEKPSITWLLA